jgi:hypothetical protein
MSNSTVDSSLSSYIASLYSISRQLSLYVALVLMIVGTIGNGLNILIFTCKNLRSNPCSLYFLFSSIANLPVIYVDMMTQMLTEYFGIPTDTSSDFVCKFKFYIVETFRALSASYIALASFDRYTSSCQNVNRRRWSTVKRSRILLSIVTIFICISYYHVPLYFHVKILLDGTLSCIGEASANGYRLFSDLYFLITYCIIPPSMMLFFGCLTIKNVRLSKRQIVPTNTTISTSLQRKDRQLIRMLIIQVVSFIPLTLPVGIRKLYALFTASLNKSQLTLATDDFAHQFLTLESIVYHSFNFFLYTMVSSVFRKELKLILKCGDKRGHHLGTKAMHNRSIIGLTNKTIQEAQRLRKEEDCTDLKMAKIKHHY